MFKKVLKHITVMVVILLVFFGSVTLGEFVMDLMTAKSTFLNVVGVAVIIISVYLFIVAIPYLVVKFKEWLREKFKMEI
jgi:hypothetical protein